MSEGSGSQQPSSEERIPIETVIRIEVKINKKTAINNSRTRAAEFEAQVEYTEANKKSYKSTRADNQKYVEELAMAAEKDVREGKMKQPYDMTTKLSGKYSKLKRPVEVKECKPITEFQEQRDRLMEHFEKLLNRLSPLNPSDIVAEDPDLPIAVTPSTTEEIRMAGRQTNQEWESIRT